MRPALLAAGYGPDRVDALYLPVVRWVLERGGEQLAPLMLGISGPQGGGKSTLAAALVTALGAAGRRAVTVSVDDFYLTHAEQQALAEAYPGNRCLELRGYPGTHDVALGVRTLRALRAGGSAWIPVYDKSAHHGRGDRAPRASWRQERGPWDVVILEGWMLGFRPGPVPPELAVPNTRLRRYAAWHDLLEVMVILTMGNPRQVVDWRVESEQTRRARGEVTLTDDEARDYVERFLPAYDAWVPGLVALPPGRAALHLVLGRDRLPR